MRIPCKRITRLRRQYKPLAQSKRLRFSDKTIRLLERKRIHTRQSFEKIYKAHEQYRVKRSVQYIARKYTLPVDQAKRIRREAIKRRESYSQRAALFFKAQAAKLAAAAELEEVAEAEAPPRLTTNFLSFYDRCLELIKKWPDARINFGSRAYLYDGKLSTFSVADAKHALDIHYKEQDPARYWVLADYVVEYNEEFDDNGNLVLLDVSLNEYQGKNNEKTK